MPLFGRYDERDEYLNSSHDSYNDRPPRRPRPTRNGSSYDDQKRSSRRHASPGRSPYRRESRDRRYESESPTKRPRTASRDLSRRDRRASRPQDDYRHDRRRSRAASPPRNEAREKRRRSRATSQAQAGYQPERRQSRAMRDVDTDAEQEVQRRDRRRQRRAERAARDPDGEAQRREDRRLRRALRRYEEDALQHEQQDAELPAPVLDHASENEHVTDGVEPTAMPEYPAQAKVTGPDVPAMDPPVAQRQEWSEDEFDFEEPYRPARQQRRGSSRHRSGRPSPRRGPRSESWQSSADDWSVDLEKKGNHSRSDSSYDELQWYKRTTMPDRHAEMRDRERRQRDERRWCCGIRRKCAICGLVALSLTILIIIIVVAVVVSKKNSFSYTPSMAQVNNTAAFSSGGATHNSVNDTKPGIGAGTDTYKYYQGKASSFPNNTLWVSFEDMWKNNVDNVQQSCGWLKYGADDTNDEIQDIYNAIQDRANASLVDHRLILALVLQESHGCVHIPHTTSSGGVKNTGLMQAHDGHEYDKHHQRLSILTMIQDGTQGTSKGDGLVQLLNTYGDPYEAARGYNSGYIPTSGDLSEAAGATACYVSDVANRLTGWVKAETKCPGGT